MTERPALVWLRRDLRIADNPALHAARESGAPVIPVFILDDDEPHFMGAASRWWLHHSLAALGEALARAGAPLVLRRGETVEAMTALAQETRAQAVFWNRRYFNGHIALDKAIKSRLQDKGVAVQTFNGALLREPWEVKTGDGGPYRVFSPFWRALRRLGPARRAPLAGMRKIPGPASPVKSDTLADWALTPDDPDWAAEFSESWTPGENGAQARLKSFLDGAINHYRDGRNRPDREHVSRLSPHLAHGEISPLQIWSAIETRVAQGEADENSAETFLSELAWREFSYGLLYFNQDLPQAPLRREFSAYPWRDDAKGLRAWRKGLTGYPIVDAGMRQLWRTGWMHNRVRMITASFLIKDLLVPWQQGEAWFSDTLVDADIANNAASWQWVAGCGADAAPYFRIFNPVTQGEKFDPNGDYVREFAPELKKLPAKYIHAPWKAPKDVLATSGIVLGKTYPFPIIDHAEARKRALAGYDDIRNT